MMMMMVSGIKKVVDVTVISTLGVGNE